jgi:hypothetical protein
MVFRTFQNILFICSVCVTLFYILNSGLPPGGGCFIIEPIGGDFYYPADFGIDIDSGILSD